MDSLNGNVLSLGCFSQYIKVHINMLEKMTVWSKTIHIVDNKEFIFPVVLIIRPWDPGIITATTWGQVVFRGSGNVMTQMETKRSPKAIKPSHQVIFQLRPKHPLHRARSATQEGRQQIIQKEEKTEGIEEHLLPPQAILRSYPPLDLYCGCSRSRVISPMSYGCDSGIRGSYPRHWRDGSAVAAAAVLPTPTQP